MLGLGLKEFQRRIFTNIFTAFQLTVILVLIIAVVSSVQSRISLYAPVSDCFEKKGIYTSGYMNDVYTEEDLIESFPEIDRIVTAHLPEATIDIGRDYKSTVQLSYTEKTIEKYKPIMKSGEWFTEKQIKNQDVIYSVIYDETERYKVGDRYNLKYSYYLPEDLDFQNPKEKNLTVEIIGVLDKNSMIFGLETEFSLSDDFRNLYTTPQRNENDFIALYCDEQIEKADIPLIMYGTKLITYSDDLDDEEADALTTEISNYATNISMKTFGERSQSYVYSEILKLFPLLICVLLLVVVSTVSISALNVKGGLKAFAIYYICGLRRGQCLMICLINSILTSVMACAATVIALNISSITGFISETVVSVNSTSIIFCIAVIAFQIAISMVMPVILMNKGSLKDTITSNE